MEITEDKNNLETPTTDAAGHRCKAQDIAIDAIFELIQRREILPGSRLFETDLEEKLSISRTPIRQAFDQLTTDGVLEKRPGQKGFFFPKLSIDDLCHAYLYREQLEMLSARLAAVNLTAESAQKVERAIENEEKLCELRVIETYRDIHNGFHATLASASCNPYLERSIQHIYMRLSFYEFYYGSYRLQKDQFAAHEVEARMIHEHEDIFRAVQGGDSDLAAALMQEHLRQSPLLTDFVQNEEAWKKLGGLVK